MRIIDPMARHKEFSEVAALDAAMRCFWAGGYEGTSTAALMSAMKIGKRSLYDTYGDKRSLYLRSIQLYIDLAEERTRAAIDDETPPAEAIRAIMISTPAGAVVPKGCFATLAATESLDDTEVSQLFDGFMQRTRARLEVQLLRAGVTPSRVPTLTRLLEDAALGVRVRARVGLVQQQEIDDIISFACGL